MSSEVVKKRGRPKKVISDPVEAEMPESSKKSTTRTKTTKAKATPSKAAKPKAPATAAEKISPLKPSTSKTTPTPLPTQTPVAKAQPAPAKKPELQTPPPATIVKDTPKSPVTPETSKIISQVRELSKKSIPTSEGIAKSSKPSPTNLDSKPIPSTPQTKMPTTPAATPAATNSKPQVVPPKPPLMPKSSPSSFRAPSAAEIARKPPIPLASLNSEIVSNIATGAGAKPNPTSGKALPSNYKNVARKITTAIVAAPIVIVTSWVLYERFVLGKEQMHLVKPEATHVESEQDVKLVPSTYTPSS